MPIKMVGLADSATGWCGQSWIKTFVHRSSYLASKQMCCRTKDWKLSLWTIGHTSIPIYWTCDDDFLVTLMRAQVTITLMTCNEGDFVDGDDDKSFVAPSREVRLKRPLHGHSCFCRGMEFGRSSIATREGLRMWGGQSLGLGSLHIAHCTWKQSAVIKLWISSQVRNDYYNHGE